MTCRAERRKREVHVTYLHASCFKKLKITKKQNRQDFSGSSARAMIPCKLLCLSRMWSRTLTAGFLWRWLLSYPLRSHILTMTNKIIKPHCQSMEGTHKVLVGLVPILKKPFGLLTPCLWFSIKWFIWIYCYMLWMWDGGCLVEPLSSICEVIDFILIP